MFQNLLEKVRIGFWLLNQKTKYSHVFFYFLLIFLPTQFGRHFWPDFSYIYGIRVDYLSPTFYFTDLLIVLLLTSWILENINWSHRIKISKKTFIKMAAFLLVVLFLILGIIISESPPAGWYGLIKFFEFSFLISYTAKNFRKLNKKLIYSSFFIGVFFESLLTIFQYINQGSVGGVMYFLGERSFNPETPGIANASINGQLFLRPYGTFSHPNVLAAYLFISMYLILLLSTRLNFKYKKLFTYFILFLGTISIFLSFSRTAIFIWTFSLCMFFIPIFWKKTGIDFVKKFKFKAAESLAAFAFILVIVIVAFYSPIPGRFSNISLSDESIVQREQLMKDAVVIFNKNFFWGTGLNNFLINLPPAEKNLHQPFYLQPVHNIFFLVIAETGIPGFTLFLILLTAIFIRIKSNREALILFLGVIFLGLFDHYFLTLQQGQILFSLLIGIALSFPKNAQR